MRVMAWHPTTSGISTAPSVCQEGRDRGGREGRERGRKEGREKWEREGRKERREGGGKEGGEKGERKKRGNRMITQHVYKGVDLQLRTPPSSLSQKKKKLNL